MTDDELNDNAQDLRAPFPWFDGKSRVAGVVWKAFGDVDNYVEPFAGSLAVLLGRPGKPKLETVNDKDYWLANFWRALQADPKGVAEAADWPVNEGDLTARHIYLVKHIAPELAERIPADPSYYDVHAAGWWVWGISSWIGSGWCSGKGPWTERDGRLVRMTEKYEAGVEQQLIPIGRSGTGVHRASLRDEEGVNIKRIHIGNAGMGVHRANLRDDGHKLYDYLAGLADRLRYVRVCCGDWARVVTDGALSHGNTVGIFLDPPYDQSLRDDGVYGTDEIGLSAAVREWAISHGDNPRYRIALCGYADEHEMPGDWAVYRWTAGASYQNASGGGRNQDNRKKETIWFSPGCLLLNGTVRHEEQLWLFGE